MKLTILKLLTLFTVLFLSSCSNDDSYVENDNPLEIKGLIKSAVFHYDNQGPHEHNYSKSTSTGFMETFESGSKGSYAGATVSVSSGDWYLSDALLGSLSNDRKYGSKSIRLRNTGYASMSFDLINGAEKVTIRHAKYGTNGTSKWRLIASYDNGVSWSYVGEEITTDSTELNTVTFTVNETNSVRYGVQKTSGGANRLNIDNFEITTTSNSGETGNPTQDSNLTFGNPSNANTNADNYFLSKPDFTLSYNNSKGSSNWVSWHLSTAWTGNSPRCNCFKQDKTLPDNFFRATTSDYTNTGFDRGHLCPSADRNGSAISNENTYYMTNIAPQAPDNNRKTWVNFENYLRTLIESGNEIHIVAGVVGSGGTGSNGFVSTIDNGNINVPDSFWKVALVLPNGSNDIERVTTATKVIAINVPNDQGVSSEWTQYQTSVDSIESLTGYDLFENIPDNIEVILESVSGSTL